ncbi:MAG: YebC/PmpR family DNA-binding transcriptional regulator [Candidatus Peregrinibacteria bacterium]
MSGHSKWANIKVRKTAQDARRGKVYTRHARLVEIAAHGGGDPSSNPTLRTAIENAREDGVPNANIERAIKKGTGELKGEQASEVVYEAYGPGSVACIIECITDNKNRTIAEVKSAIEKHGGRWAESGAVRWMFDHKGVVRGEKASKIPEEMELQLIDAGAEDIGQEEDAVEVVTATAGFGKVRDVLKNAGYVIKQSGLQYIPKQTTEVSSLDTARKLMDFVEAIEANEDVTEVHTNAVIAKEIGDQLV